EESHLVRIDMNELTTPYAAEQLVGTFESPDGRLTSAIRRQPNCVILLDEIEKAHPDVFDYLLQVLGEGRLTDARGRVADFRSAVIIMTSNLGASEQNSSLGFEFTPQRREQIYLKAAQQFFRPEFFNRIDEVVPFRNLDSTDMEKIVAIQLGQVLSRDGIKRRDIFVDVDRSAIKHIIRRGHDSELGARAVRRMLESQVMGPLGDCLAGLHIDRPTLVQVSHPPNALELSCRVRPLQIAARQSTARLSAWEPLIEQAGALNQQLDHRLVELEEELRETDRRTTGQTHGASYYALREQLYRCAETLKAAKVRATRTIGPRLDINPVAPSVSRRDHDSSGARRTIRDWHAQDDLRAAINEQQMLLQPEMRSDDRLARQLIDNLTIASSMIDAAQSARCWLFGFELLTHGTGLLDGNSLELSRGRKGAGDFQPSRNIQIRDSSPATSAATRLVRCLSEGWMYEVADQVFQERYWLVSGVSLIGILRPLLGTYRLNMAQQRSANGASHLLAMRAIAVPNDCAVDYLAATATPTSAASLPTRLSAELMALIASEPLLADDGTLLTPVGQTWPTSTVRGELAATVVDYVSGASLPLWPIGWVDPSKALAQSMQWWTDCLPVPRSLQEP
ncbi:MAG: AAA family ATPase, partial [Aureliella sp.]